MTKRLIQNKISNRSLAEIALTFMGSGMDKGWKPIAERRVARFGADNDDLVIDTSFVEDTNLFEIGIIDKRYREDGHWIIVEEFKTKEEAQSAHDKWVRVLTGDNPPDEIEDIQDAGKVHRLKGGGETN